MLSFYPLSKTKWFNIIDSCVSMKLSWSKSIRNMKHFLSRSESLCIKGSTI